MMQRRKSFKILSVFPSAVLFASFLTLSCSFNENVHEYFDVMTNTASIERHVVNASTQSGSGGKLCVSSAEGPVIVSYYLRNPMNFVFIDSQSLIYGLVSSEAQSADGSNGINVRQSLSDPSVITLKYPIEFLKAMEGGFAPISEALNIKHPYSLEDFGTYSFSLYCNSAPPLMKGGVCLFNPLTNKTVLFMKLPDADSLRYIHKDLKYIRINGRSFEIESSSNPGTINFTGADDLKALSAISVEQSSGKVTYDSVTYERVNQSNAVFVPGDAGTNLFLQTGDDLQRDKVYTVELVDKLGFSSAIEIDADANQIGEVTYCTPAGTVVKYTDSSGIEHDASGAVETIYGDGDKAYLVLVPPEGHGDAILSYRIYRDSEASENFVVSASVRGRQGIAVPCPTTAGSEETYVIKAYAHKNRYADSAESTCTVKTKPFVYTEGGGISAAGSLMVWADGKKASQTAIGSNLLELTRGSVSIPLVATSPSATGPTSDVIETGVIWSWQILLSGSPSTSASPNYGSSSTVAFDSSSCSTDCFYQLRVRAGYGGMENVFYFNLKFTD